MKAVVISIVLLVSVVVGTLLNAKWVNSEIDRMRQLTEDIYNNVDDRAENVEKLYDLWERSRKVLALSASFRELDRATEHIITLRAACQSNNEWAITQGCLLVCAALDDIARYEKCTVSSIL